MGKNVTPKIKEYSEGRKAVRVSFEIDERLFNGIQERAVKDRRTFNDEIIIALEVFLTPSPSTRKGSR